MNLTTVELVERFLDRKLTADEKERAEGLMEYASELFAREAKNSFGTETVTVTLKCDGNRVIMPESGIIVKSVTVAPDTTPVEFSKTGAFIDVAGTGSYSFLTVTYTRESVEVPPIVANKVAEIVARFLRIDPDAAAGVSQKSLTTGPFTEASTFASWAVGGQIMLSPADVEVARSYRRPRTGHTWVSRT